MNTKAPPTSKDVFDMWGDCEVAGWEKNETKLWNLWLNGAALLLFFTDEAASKRIKASVNEIIAQAKTAQITARQALYQLRLGNLITPEEWPAICEAVKKDGKMVGDYLFSSSGKSTQ